MRRIAKSTTCLTLLAAFSGEAIAGVHHVNAPRGLTAPRPSSYAAATIQPAALGVARAAAAPLLPSSVGAPAGAPASPVVRWETVSPPGAAAPAAAVPIAAAPAAAASAAAAPPQAANDGPVPDATRTLRSLGGGSAKPASARARAAAAFDGALEGEGRDLTVEYEAARRVAPGASLRAAGRSELKALHGYKILLVPGFMSGAAI